MFSIEKNVQSILEDAAKFDRDEFALASLNQVSLWSAAPADRFELEGLRLRRHSHGPCCLSANSTTTRFARLPRFERTKQSSQLTVLHAVGRLRIVQRQMREMVKTLLQTRFSRCSNVLKNDFKTGLILSSLKLRDQFIGLHVSASVKHSVCSLIKRAIKID